MWQNLSKNESFFLQLLIFDYRVNKFTKSIVFTAFKVTKAQKRLNIYSQCWKITQKVSLYTLFEIFIFCPTRLKMLFRSKTAIKILFQTSITVISNIGKIANFTITIFASDAKSKQTRSTLSNVFNSISILRRC